MFHLHENITHSFRFGRIVPQDLLFNSKSIYEVVPSLKGAAELCIHHIYIYYYIIIYSRTCGIDGIVVYSTMHVFSPKQLESGRQSVPTLNPQILRSARPTPTEINPAPFRQPTNPPRPTNANTLRTTRTGGAIRPAGAMCQIYLRGSRFRVRGLRAFPLLRFPLIRILSPSRFCPEKWVTFNGF